MLIFTKIADLQAFLTQKRKAGQSIGFVPTMGALHPGHISLIEIAGKQCNIVICSIFVNPTQFNDKKDLEKYPRTLEKDTELLKKSGCDALFAPTVEEMYPERDKIAFDFGDLDKILEGEHRPGHFNGVAQVVKRFFEIIEPNKAFFGSKDYQQVMIVKALVKQMNSAIQVIACPILREPDGLAMSSRNVLLSSEERKIAGVIPGIMKEAKKLALESGIMAAKDYVKKETGAFPQMKLEYYEICNADTLSALNETDDLNGVVSLIAIFVGKIRLIDNLIL